METTSSAGFSANAVNDSTASARSCRGWHTVRPGTTRRGWCDTSTGGGAGVFRQGAPATRPSIFSGGGAAGESSSREVAERKAGYEWCVNVGSGAGGGTRGRRRLGDVEAGTSLHRHAPGDGAGEGGYGGLARRISDQRNTARFLMSGCRLL